MSPAITGVVIQDYIHTAHSSGIQCSVSDPELTSREREVLQLLAEGKSTRDMASCLNLSMKTIETHRQNIMDKLHLYSIAELTKYAIMEGLTELKVITAQLTNKNDKGGGTNTSGLAKITVNSKTMSLNVKGRVSNGPAIFILDFH